jgi:hypothetical protein
MELRRNFILANSNAKKYLKALLSLLDLCILFDVANYSWDPISVWQGDKHG